MRAAHLLPRDRCAVRLNSRRRYAPVLPLLAVARVGRGRVVALRPCGYFGAALLPPVTITTSTSTTRPPSAGIVSPAGRIAAAVIRRGPLSRYACYDCNNYIDLHYILYLQYCTIRNDYKPFMRCIIWSIWHFLREFLGSESLVNQRFAGHLSLRGLR